MIPSKSNFCLYFFSLECVLLRPMLQSAPRATSTHVINGRLVPFVTVVTDLGEAHPWWFNRGVAKLFVPTPDMKAQV